ncbi:MAG: acyl-CoA dehydratase activase-related protein, partial [Streptococcaceae bacterium]|nr:acyl-CoA dehydratase activase-related protein [Streptococcaceae bacterium]
LIDESERLLFEHYGNNDGQPLENVIEVLTSLLKTLPKNVYIANASVTGYGEQLIKNALRIDTSEVETMAHYKAANHFLPGVEFILDIGGQDMKAMRIQDGALSSIQLNEACSSGCGSFIETFAKSLHYPVELFAKEAIISKNPVDLGSRCTVFMNSKVKQVQKEGASVADISAGLSYSVIKNAIYKVIKVKRPEELGEKIVVQGGTFYNEAILRAFEIVTGRTAVRPSIAGLMGAYGSALIAKERKLDDTPSTLLSLVELTEFQTEREFMNCSLCENHCKLTLTLFSDGRKFVSGNRCERGAQSVMDVKITKKPKEVNLVNAKYKRLFQYRSLSKSKATRGEIGIPRVLNIYENYPLWHTFFTNLGFRVVLSPRSNKELYEKGMETIPSDTVCYPAKIAHGHIQSLINDGVKRIFYPGIIFERDEDKDADNHYNCPIVQSYPEVLRNNVDEIRDGQIDYLSPFLNLADKQSLINNFTNLFRLDGITKSEIELALNKGFLELEKFKQEIQQLGEDTLLRMKMHGEKGIVLAGRPYHLDPEIHHGIANIITQEGFHVLTEDSISHLANVDNLRVVNQWVYHSRLYAAARVTARTPNLEFVQLNSFGCGLDAVTSDQVEEILQQHGKIYTALKIDEGSNLGAIRIRVRSLKSATIEREKQNFIPKKILKQAENVIFTKQMKKKHTLLMPMLSPIHQDGLLDEAFLASGYNVVTLPAKDEMSVHTGLKYVNNDACYPAILSIGQLIEALNSGKYDLENVSVVMTQTGGGCRATNYIPLLRKALQDAGFPQVPVVSISMGNKGVEETPGFSWTLPFLKRFVVSFMYGDLFERVVYRTRPYELVEGSADRLHEEWKKKVKANVRNGSFTQFNRNMKQIIHDFDTLPITDEVKPKVGVVGEILVKYSPTANNDIVRLLESEGAEVVVPDIIGFMNYSLYNQIWRHKHLGMSQRAKQFAKVGIKLIELIEKPMNKALIQSERFEGITSIYEIAENAEKIISPGNHTGEGWFLTGEMIELLKEDVNNIVCMQPFGCLPNHVVGKGVIKELRSQYPKANIAPIDYDPGASFVNQLNRIRLMLATAKKEMREGVSNRNL